MPTSSTCHAVALLPMLDVPNSRNMYCPATWARLAMTRTSAATIAQPPAQPVLGPNARVGLVHLAVADRAEQHRDEGQQGDRGRLEPHRGHHEEQGRRQAVGGSRRGDAHQALVFVFFDWLKV